MQKIGFIGLGHMGLPMAINLLKANFQVIGFEKSTERLKLLEAAGGQVAASIAELYDQEVLITMLQTGDQVRSVCLGEDGLLANAKAGTLYIDCSSIDVVSSRAIHEQASAKGIDVVDAPVSGGVSGAVAGTLTFMVGGKSEAMLKAEPILSLMGKRVIHTGGAGSGQAAKICNNMILGISMIAISEAFQLAQGLGLEAKKLFEVVNHASGQCWAMSNYVPVADLLPNVPANRGFEPGFTSSMMFKDLSLSQHAAETAGVKTQMGHLAASIYEHWIEKGHGELDFSSIIDGLT